MERRGPQSRGEPRSNQEVGARTYPQIIQRPSRHGSSQDINRRSVPSTHESSSGHQRPVPCNSRSAVAAQAVPDQFPGADSHRSGPCSSLGMQSSRSRPMEVYTTSSNSMTPNMASSAAQTAISHSTGGMRSVSDWHRQHQEEEVETDGDQGTESVRRLEARVQTLQRQLAGLQRYTALVQQIGARQSETEVENQPAAQAEAHVGRRRVLAGPAERQNRRTRRIMPDSRRGEEEDEADDAQGGGEDSQFHVGVSCDGCGAGPLLIGTVMKCQDCDNVDFCARCFRDRNQLGPHRNHRFAPRQPSSDRPMLVADMLLGLMEEDMLQEAMRQSSEGQRDNEPEPVDPEIRAAEILSKLPRTQWKSKGHCVKECEMEECALCLDNFKSGEDVLTLPCEHFFHESCLTPWLIKSNLCPLCKQDALASDP